LTGFAVPKAASDVSLIFSICRLRYCNLTFLNLSCYSHDVKAILSQFAKQLDNNEAPSVPKSKKTRVPAKRKARILVNDSSDDDDISDGMRHDASDDTLDQDEDVIRVAEEAQEADLNDAAESAGLEVTVMDDEQKAASTALSKASVVVFHFNKRLLIMLDSSRDLRTR
jgi:hypothetical protein